MTRKAIGLAVAALLALGLAVAPAHATGGCMVPSGPGTCNFNGDGHPGAYVVATTGSWAITGGGQVFASGTGPATAGFTCPSVNITLTLNGTGWGSIGCV